MNKFKKLTAAAAVTAAIGGVAMPAAQAVILGVPGEALLVPFVMWGGTTAATATNATVNTYIGITAPSAVYKDDVWNKYTAPTTTGSGSFTMPTGTDGDNYDQNDPNGVKAHWFFFDAKSEHQLNGEYSMSPDDLDVFDWAAVATGLQGSVGSLGLFRNEPGYLIFATEAARSGGAANFVMMGNAVMHFGTVAAGEYVPIPVMAMADGVDGAYPTPSLGNEVIWGSNLPVQVSPVITGIRMNNASGVNGDADVIFDLSVGPRMGDLSDTLHVIWLDRCGNGISGAGCAAGTRTAQVDNFDANENQCSSTVDIGMELNLILIDTPEIPGRSVNLTQPNPLDFNLPPSTVASRPFCDPTGTPWNTGSPNLNPPTGNTTMVATPTAEPGFSMYTINEIGDAQNGRPDSGAVGFSLIAGPAGGFGRTPTMGAGVTAVFVVGGPWIPTATRVEFALSHERGKK